MQDPYKKRQFRGIVLPIDNIRKDPHPFGIQPTDEFRRQLIVLAASKTYANKYRLIEDGFALARELHNYHRIDTMDFEKYSYTYWCRFKYNPALKPMYYVYLRCRDKKGKYIHRQPPLPFMRDIVHLERFVNKEEIYPMHLPTGCMWNSRWKIRKELTRRLMHVHYTGRKVSKKATVTTAERKARTRHMNEAVKTFPALVPGEAYMRYAMILFQRMPHYKQKRLSDDMAVCEVHRKAGIPYEGPDTVPVKDKLLP